MSGGFSPSDVANQAIDAVGWPDMLGDIQDGSQQAQVVLRAYGECLKQLLRAAHWDFARAQASLLLLGDATGNTANVGTLVQRPWAYCYALPTDCAKARFVPLNYDNPSTLGALVDANTTLPATPLVTGLGVDPNQFGQTLQPARFILASDSNYPPDAGQQSWQTPGVSPQGRTVINTNVRNAQLVYTRQMIYPSVWDALFRSAFVAYLAAEIALPLWAKTDRKFGLQMRNEQIPLVKAKVMEARAVNGNEGFPNTSDIRVDWMDGRRSGGSQWTGMGGLGFNNDIGVFGYGVDNLVVGGAAF